MQKLLIGITRPEPGWLRILEQEGLPFQVISPLIPLRTPDFSVIIVNHIVDKDEWHILKNYLADGGAILSNFDCFQNTKLAKTGRYFISQIIPDRNRIFSHVQPVDLFLPGQVSDDARIGSIGKSKNGALLSNRHDKGHFILLPFDVQQAMLDLRIDRKIFYVSKNLSRPSEKMSVVSKGEVRKLVANCLRALHEARGLPYVHLWYHPFQYRTSFALRIDTDSATRSRVTELFQIGLKHKFVFDWFVNVKGHADLVGFFSKMAKKGHNIGVHGFEHRVFNSVEKNVANLMRAQEILMQTNIKVRGCTAPHGLWNEALGRAIDVLKIPYSSEFTIDYDNLPFYPVVDGKVFDHLQIPVHPICIGRLARAGYETKQMRDYFGILIARYTNSGQPIFLYHHPGHGHALVINEIIEKIKAAKTVQLTNFYDYFRWWQQRRAIQYSVSFHRGVLLIKSHSFPAPASLHIIFNNRETFTSPRSRISLGRLSWQELPASQVRTLPPARINRFRKWREDFGDWIIKRIRK